MSVNMFEGARRIMKLGMIIIALIGIYAAFDASSDPQVAATPQQGKTYLGEEVDFDPFADEPAVIPSANAEDFDPDAYLASKAQPESPAQQPAPVEQQVADRLPKNEYISDPALLAQLNGDGADDSYVKDEALLSQLNGTPQNKQTAPVAQPQQAQETIKPWEKYKTTATEQPKPVQPIDHYEQQAANDEQFVNKQYWPKKAKAILMPLGITALSICGFWIFCWIIGWVVRGFTGISMGQDRKN